MRTNDCTPQDHDVLQSRVITADSPNYPTHMLHVYGLNYYANHPNKLRLNSMAAECEQYTIKSSDAVAGETIHIDLESHVFLKIEMKLVAFMVPLRLWSTVS